MTYKAAGGEEGKARMGGGGHDKEVASSNDLLIYIINIVALRRG